MTAEQEAVDVIEGAIKQILRLNWTDPLDGSPEKKVDARRHAGEAVNALAKALGVFRSSP